MFFSSEKGFENRRVTRNKREVDPQEALLDSLAQRKEFFHQRRFEVPLKEGLVRSFFLFFAFLLFFLMGKAAWLCLRKKKKYRSLARANYERLYFERAERGVIYDRNFEQLVFNETAFSLGCYKKDLPGEEEERRRVIEKAAGLIGKEPSFISGKLAQGEEERILLVEDLSHEKVVALKTEISRLPGFYLKESPRRRYASAEVFSHLVGFLGRPGREELEKEDVSPLDLMGKSGLEKSYEEVLRGEKEKRVVKKDAFSRKLSEKVVREKKPGQSLVLTVGTDLQKKSFRALKQGLERVGSGSGVVVALDPESGEILSLVSLPSFDNNLFSEEKGQKEWEEIFESRGNAFWNRALSGLYPTGSTIKPLVAVGALEEGIIGSREVINCKGKIVVENPWFEDKPWVFHDWRRHGPTDMRKAIAESCNVYFYTVGGGYEEREGLGVEKLKHYLRLFGWGQRTGIDLPGEKSGFIPDPSWKKEHFEGSRATWLPGDTYNLSIGQGYLSVTPLQVVSSFASLANGGKLVEPQLVKEIVDEKRNPVRRFGSETRRKNFVEREHLEVAREGMRGAVTYGSATLLADLPVKAAAKTGTAQTGKESQYHNWVTVFAPYRDPEIVLTVLVEKVTEEQVAALPIAKQILASYFHR